MSPVTTSIDESTTNRNSDKKKSKYETRTEGHLKQGDNSCLQSKFCSHFLTLHQKLIGIYRFYFLNREVLVPDVVLPYNKIPFSARDLLTLSKQSYSGCSELS